MLKLLRTSLHILPLLIILCSLPLLTQDGRPRPQGLSPTALSACPALELGDVVLRQGFGTDSVLIAEVSHSKYSHVGMVAELEPELIIIHAATTDLPDPKLHNQVIKSTLYEFGGNARRLAIKRYSLNPEQKAQIADFLHSMLGQAFVLDGKKGSLYCSTLVMQALSPHLGEERFAYSYLEMPIFRGWYLYPETFMADGRSELIFKAEAESQL